MENVEFLLSDEYVAFSGHISQIHEEKKTLKEEFKKKYEAFTARTKELDDQVKELVENWEAWKKEQLEVKEEE
jgi:phage-related minor tail protein